MKNLVKKFGFKAALAAFVLALAACGGYSSISIGGSVYGLVTSGLVIANNGQSLTIPANATTYTFPGQIDTHGKYAVTIVSQPARYTCVVSGGSGTATGIAISTINLYCSVNTYAVGGTIEGLVGTGLQLTNGSDTIAPAAGATSFAFSTTVADGSPYGAAILTQPSGQTCTIQNGTAVMGSAAVTNIKVVCQ